MPDAANNKFNAAVNDLGYSCDDPELADFSFWLADLMSQSEFKRKCDRYVNIYQKLRTESNPQERRNLLNEANALSES